MIHSEAGKYFKSSVMWPWRSCALHHSCTDWPSSARKYSHTSLTWTLNPRLPFSHGMKLKAHSGMVGGGGLPVVFPCTAIFLPHILKCNWVVEDERPRRGAVGIIWWLMAKNTKMREDSGNHTLSYESQRRTFHQINSLNRLHPWSKLAVHRKIVE